MRRFRLLSSSLLAALLGLTLAHAAAPKAEAPGEPLAQVDPPPASAPAPAAPADPPAASAPAPAAPADAALAPSFALPDLRGSLVESGYASRPVTMVHFWASWCVPCMREIPVLNRLAATYEPSGAAIFAVAMSSGIAADLRQLVRAYDIRHTILLGTEPLAREFGGIPMFPTTFLVDRRGRILGKFTGASEDTQRRVEARLRSLLSPPLPQTHPPGDETPD